MNVPLQKILFATDLSDFSNQASQIGVSLAKEFDAKLFACHVVDFSSMAIYGDGMFATVERQDQLEKHTLTSLKEAMGDPPVPWEPVVAMGHAGDEITRIAEEKDADLVITASRCRTGLKRLILGSVTGRLLRTLNRPLLVARGPDVGPTPEKDGFIRFRRILVGCDFSSDSNLALDFALGLAQHYESELHLAHVVQPPVYMDLMKSPKTAGEDYPNDLHERLEKELTLLVPQEARNWCKPKAVLLAGHPHEELTKYSVVHGIDLIVLGIRGHGMVETLFVGSTTDRVVRQAPCPVLIVLKKTDETPEA